MHDGGGGGGGGDFGGGGGGHHGGGDFGGGFGGHHGGGHHGGHSGGGLFGGSHQRQGDGTGDSLDADPDGFEARRYRGGPLRRANRLFRMVMRFVTLAIIAYAIYLLVHGMSATP